MDSKLAKDMLDAGTGFMGSLEDGILHLQKKGYSENLTLKVDHFESEVGKIKITAEEFCIDEVLRFENTSDPEDQSILYAITSAKQNLRGLFVESYGLYHDEMSEAMLQRFKEEVLRHNKSLMKSE